MEPLSCANSQEGSPIHSSKLHTNRVDTMHPHFGECETRASITQKSQPVNTVIAEKTTYSLQRATPLLHLADGIIPILARKRLFADVGLVSRLFRAGECGHTKFVDEIRPLVGRVGATLLTRVGYLGPLIRANSVGFDTIMGIYFWPSCFYLGRGLV